MNENNTEMTNCEHSDESQSLDHVRQTRREKLAHLRELGINPYPYSFSYSHSVKSVLSDFEQLIKDEKVVKIAGRISAMRPMGKTAFLHITDEGEKIQVYFKREDFPEKFWEVFKLLDIGDIIGVKGTLFLTKTGEKTVRVISFVLLSKNLRPLPAVKETEEKVYYKWEDKEARYRQRTVDLILNKESRDKLLMRSKITLEIRKFMESEGYIEVETPILQPLYGGASAKPFTTHYNALDHTFYLRIADELYLKRLIAGGINRVYEIGKVFRNEGISRLHSPEFTMMECYASYQDYHYCADFIERLFSKLALEIVGNGEISFEGYKINLESPYERVTMADLVRDKCGVEIINRNRDELAEEVAKLGIPVDKSWGVGKIIDELFSEKIEPTLVQPTFVFDYPIELSPLAKIHRSIPGLVERFELFVGGLEIANSFSELNDPIDQRVRFEEQVRLRSAGDEEAHPIDEDFLESLEYAMPPTGGYWSGD